MLREIIYNDWYTAIIIVSLTIIVSAKLLNPNRFIDFMRLLGNSNYLRIHFKDHRFLDPFDVLLFINFCTNAVLTLILTYSYYSSMANLTHADFVKLVAVLGLGFITKMLLELGIGSLFEIQKLSHSYVFQKVSTLNFLGVLLLPLNALFIFRFPDQGRLLVIILTFSGLIILIGLFKSIKSYQKLLINNLFYFILYLCTLEIGPYVILCKLFSYDIN
jgi:hypothetical protein